MGLYIFPFHWTSLGLWQLPFFQKKKKKNKKKQAKRERGREGETTERDRWEMGHCFSMSRIDRNSSSLTAPPPTSLPVAAYHACQPHEGSKTERNRERDQ